MIESISVSPLVLFNALDHHTRRSSSYIYEGEAFLTNSFPLKHFSDLSDFPDTVSFISNFLRTSTQRPTSICPSVEEFLGFYCTSLEIEPFTRSLSSYLQEHQVPLVISVDTSLAEKDVKVCGYVQDLSTRTFSSMETSIKVSSSEQPMLQVIGHSALNETPLSSIGTLTSMKEDIGALRSYLEDPSVPKDDDVTKEIGSVLGRLASETGEQASLQVKTLVSLRALAKEIMERNVLLEEKMRA
ncbi:hypothetical protein GEMRC1_003533 [Eukaryota sp. GEM-RC1]